jgi:hypothetical protein
MYERTQLLRTSSQAWEKLTFRIGRSVARAKFWLRRHGIQVSVSVSDLARGATAGARLPRCEWLWRGHIAREAQVEAVLSWLDEAILRAPVIRGLDRQMCALWVGTRDGREVGFQEWALAKYDWRARGRREVGEWLAAKLATPDEAALAIVAHTASLGLILRRYAELTRPG